ncbi:MAG: PKD domain-containing protein [Thermoplasmata archaeon]|nr:PKD domain-containing protein [Thermoplasmata archaeon]
MASKSPRCRVETLLSLSALLVLLASPGAGTPSNHAAKPVFEARGIGTSAGAILGGVVRDPTTPSVGPSAGDHWSLITPVGLPGARDQSAMTFDPSDNATILFGGFNASNGRAENDTWIFYQGAWTNISFALPKAPSPRWGAALTFDALDNETVLFGGRNATAYFGDTWTFGALGWTQLSPTKAPSPRVAGVTDDVRSGDVVLFGGTYRSLTATPGPVVGYNDTWFFRGGAWFNVTASSGPGPTTSGTVVYDPLDHYVFLLGPGPSTGHAWVLTKGKWHGILSAGAPGAPVLNGTFTWDSKGQFVLLFGTSGGAGPSNQTWTYRAGGWTNLTANLSMAPPIRANASIDFDRGADAVLLLDGNSPRTGGADRNDLWEFHGVPFRVNLTSTPLVTDIDHPVLLQDLLTETGGVGFVYGYVYTQLPPGCLTGNVSNLACDPLVAGDYLVNTTVNRSDGTAIRAALELQVNPLPAVQLIAPTTVTDPGLALSFSASTANGTPPYQVLWNLGDNSTANTSTVLHAYAKPGVDHVNVTVTDAVGSIAEYGIVVTIDTNLTVSTGANRTTTEIGLPIAFHSVPAGGTAPYTVQWTFGNGASGSGANISYAFPSTGTFTANATVTDAAGEARIASIPIVVTERPHVGVMVNRTITDAAVPVEFGVALVGGVGPFQYSWIFSDGSSANGSQVVHDFDATGPASATVTVTDGNGVTTANSSSVLVEPRPGVNAEIGQVRGCGGPSTVTFQSQGSGGVAPYDYQWTFGDHSPNVTGANSTHLFQSEGPFVVTVRLTDAVGATAAQSMNYSALACTGATGAAGGIGGLPTWAYGLLTLAVVAVVLGLYLWRRGRPGARPAVPPPDPASPGTVTPLRPEWQEEEPPRPGS